MDAVHEPSPVLHAVKGGCRERRNQLVHPA
jgi:hypothetical protein